MREPAAIGAAVLVSCLLGGCASYQSAAYDSVRGFWHHNTAIEQQPLQPGVRYLRVTVNGQVAMLALAYLDRDEAGREVQVWYSADGEVIRLQGGRLVGVVGTPIEWRKMKLPSDLPAWQPDAPAFDYLRVRDQMPGYHLGQMDHITVQRLLAPPGDGAQQLKGLQASELIWFEETEQTHATPPARLAVRVRDGKARAVYGQQCLDDRFCLTWQAWPAGQTL